MAKEIFVLGIILFVISIPFLILLPLIGILGILLGIIFILVGIVTEEAKPTPVPPPPTQRVEKLPTLTPKKEAKPTPVPPPPTPIKPKTEKSKVETQKIGAVKAKEKLPAPGYIYCPYCGEQIPKASKFCPNCGAALD